eukprot:scaffold75484_cov49-Prasinocladus_malaysianus.AAC.1
MGVFQVPGATAGSAVSFYIAFQDEYGNQVTNYDINFESQVALELRVTQGSGFSTVDTIETVRGFTQQPDGRWKVEYQPSLAGSLSVSISVYGVEGPTATGTIKAGGTNAAHSYLTGQGLSAVQIGVLSKFCVVARDIANNLVSSTSDAFVIQPAVGMIMDGAGNSAVAEGGGKYCFSYTVTDTALADTTLTFSVKLKTVSGDINVGTASSDIINSVPSPVSALVLSSAGEPSVVDFIVEGEGLLGAYACAGEADGCTGGILLVTPRDTNGLVVTDCGSVCSAFTATLTQAGVPLALPTSQELLSNGTYVVRYYHDSVGQYSLAIGVESDTLLAVGEAMIGASQSIEIAPGFTDPAATVATLSTPSPVAGALVQVLIQPFDRYGNAQVYSDRYKSDLFSGVAVLQPTSSNLAPAMTAVKLDNQYTLSVQLTKAGTYEINVLLGGTSFETLTVTVAPGEISSQGTYVSGKSTVVAGDDISLAIHPLDEYGNAVTTAGVAATVSVFNEAGEPYSDSSGNPVTFDVPSGAVNGVFTATTSALTSGGLLYARAVLSGGTRTVVVEDFPISVTASDLNAAATGVDYTTSATDLTKVEAGTQVTVPIIVRDLYGNIVTGNEYSFSTSMTRASDGAKIFGEVVPSGEPGRYTVLYTEDKLKFAGSYTLSVTYGGVEIGGAPVDGVAADENPAFPRTVTVSAPRASPTTSTIHMVDASGNTGRMVEGCGGVPSEDYTCPDFMKGYAGVQNKFRVMAIDMFGQVETIARTPSEFLRVTIQPIIPAAQLSVSAPAQIAEMTELAKVATPVISAVDGEQGTYEITWTGELTIFTILSRAFEVLYRVEVQMQLSDGSFEPVADSPVFAKVYSGQPYPLNTLRQTTYSKTTTLADNGNLLYAFAEVRLHDELFNVYDRDDYVDVSITATHSANSSRAVKFLEVERLDNGGNRLSPETGVWLVAIGDTLFGDWFVDVYINGAPISFGVPLIMYISAGPVVVSSGFVDSFEAEVNAPVLTTIQGRDVYGNPTSLQEFIANNNLGNAGSTGDVTIQTNSYKFTTSLVLRITSGSSYTEETNGIADGVVSPYFVDKEIYLGFTPARAGTLVIKVLFEYNIEGIYKSTEFQGTGEILPGAIDVTQDGWVSGLGASGGVSGSTSVLVIDPVDINGNQVPGGCTDFSLSATDESGVATTINVNVTVRPDGSCAAEYDIPVAGNYNLNVLYQDQEVKAFSVEIADAATVVQTLDPTRTQVSGSGLSGTVTAGANQVFQVVLSDTLGRTFAGGGVAPQVTVTGPSGPVDVFQIELYPGGFSYSYKPTIAGEYKVAVTVDSVAVTVTESMKPLPGAVIVKPAATDPSACEVIVSATAVLANEQFSITVNPKDQFGNPQDYGLNPEETLYYRVDDVLSTIEVSSDLVALDLDGLQHIAYVTIPSASRYQLPVFFDNVQINVPASVVEVSVGPADTTNVVIEGYSAGTGAAGETSTFFVSMRDDGDNVIADPAQYLDTISQITAVMKLVDPVTGGFVEGADIPVEVVYDESRGQFALSYSPNTSGNYQLDLSVGEATVKPEGYSATVVTSGGISTTHCTVEGLPVLPATRQLSADPVTFFIIARDQFGNRLRSNPNALFSVKFSERINGELTGLVYRATSANIAWNDDLDHYEVDVFVMTTGEFDVSVTRTELVNGEATTIKVENGAERIVKIVAGVADPTQSTISMGTSSDGFETVIQAGDLIPIQIQAKDLQGNVKDDDGGDYRVTLATAGGGFISAKMTPVPGQPGVYEALVSADQAGAGNTVVEISYLPSDGSGAVTVATQTITVAPAPLSVANTTTMLVEGGSWSLGPDTGTYMGPAGDLIEFLVTLRDGFGNKLSATDLGAAAYAMLPDGTQVDAVVTDTGAFMLSFTLETATLSSVEVFVDATTGRKLLAPELATVLDFQVSPGKPSLASSSVVISDQGALVMTDHTIKISLQDAYGNLADDAGQYLLDNVKLLNIFGGEPNFGSIELPFTCADDCTVDANGEYTITFMPGEVGTVKMVVVDPDTEEALLTADNTAFTTEVLAGVASPSKSTYAGAGVSGAASGSTVSFVVQTKDASGNIKTTPNVDPVTGVEVLPVVSFNQPNVDAVVEYIGDGKYSISYVAPSANDLGVDAQTGVAAMSVSVEMGGLTTTQSVTLVANPGDSTNPNPAVSIAVSSLAPNLYIPAKNKAIQIGSLNIPAGKLYGATAGVAMEFDILARNSDGIQMKGGGADVKVDVVPQTKVPPNVQDMGDGSYKVRFTTTVAAEYFVTATINGEPIRNGEMQFV